MLYQNFQQIRPCAQISTDDSLITGAAADFRGCRHAHAAQPATNLTPSSSHLFARDSQAMSMKLPITRILEFLLLSCWLVAACSSEGNSSGASGGAVGSGGFTNTAGSVSSGGSSTSGGV